MADNEHNDQIIKWLNGELPEEQLMQEIGADNLLKYKQIIQEVDQWTPDNESVIFDPAVVTKKGKVMTMTRWMSLSVAASVVLVALFSIWMLRSDRTVHFTKAGETKQITLPDGLSIVTLAANSKVSWTEDDWNSSERRLEIDGKGFFQVEKGTPFSVAFETGEVTVLGTSFEVSEFDESFQVICFEGKVRATDKNQGSRIVSAGEGYLYHHDQWEEKLNITDTQPSWLQEETKFDNVPLAMVLKTLENEYDIQIIKNNVKLERRFTGSIPNKNLALALKIVFDPLGISYEMKESKLTLSE